MQHFAAIRARAAKRKGGDAELIALLPKVKSAAALARIKDDRLLSDMTKRIPLTHLSRICAMSIGENYDAATLGSRSDMAEGDIP
jgi:hypothetical protein